jgi:uncharacterized damage-inducible protein DinB
MIELLRELFRYQAWADSQILAAVRAHAPAADDEQIRKTLHHIVGVQRFFVSQVENREFHAEAEMRVPETLSALETLFEEAHANGLRCVDSLTATDLDRPLDRPPLEKLRPTVLVALMQVVLHSQHHRGQVATRLKAVGATPPTVDYILMATKT